jgi:uncharacterized protein YaaN involved in tellurite resistance
MVTEEKNEKTEKTEMTDIVSMEIAEVNPAVKPKNLTEAQADNIKEQAKKAVDNLVKSEGANSLTVADQITNIGVQDQKKVTSSIELLQEKMGNVFYGENKNAVTEKITTDIGTLQTALARINPKDIQKESLYRILRYVPFIGNWAVRVLKESANRGMEIKEFVEHLDETIKHGENMLRMDNAQLTAMYAEIEEKQKLIGTDAYFAEVLMEELDKVTKDMTDEKKKNSLKKVLFKVATRASDLRIMENLHEQFFVSIAMTRDNNDYLIDAGRRLRTGAVPLVAISFAIYNALSRQKKVLEVAKATKEFLGNQMLTNATMINNAVTDIGDIVKQPMIAMEKIEAAIAQLEQAIDKTNLIQTEGIERAKETITRVTVMTEEIRKKATELPDTDVKSLEGSSIINGDFKLLENK